MPIDPDPCTDTCPPDDWRGTPSLVKGTLDAPACPNIGSGSGSGSGSGGGVTIDVLTADCLVPISGGGYALKNQRVRLTLPPGTTISPPFCVTNPTDCCVSYNCVEGICVDPGDGTGIFPTLDICQSICVTYKCTTVAGVPTCVPVYDGSGIYLTLIDCENACLTPPPPICCGDSTNRTGTLSNLTGSCTCLAFVTGITFVTSGVDQWIAGLAVFGRAGCTDGVVIFTLTCSGSYSMTVTDTLGAPVGSAVLVGATCTPFVLVFDVMLNGTICTGTFRLTIM